MSDQFTWEQLPEAIEALQNGDDIDYQGVTGDVEFDDAGEKTFYATYTAYSGRAIRSELMAHERMEEDIFYPALRSARNSNIC